MKSFLAKQLIGALMLSCFTGCASHSASHLQAKAHLNAVVETRCLTGPVLLKGCEPNSSPLKCHIIQARYRPGCERWEVEGEPKTSQPDKP